MLAVTKLKYVAHQPTNLKHAVHQLTKLKLHRHPLSHPQLPLRQKLKRVGRPPYSSKWWNY